MARNNIINFKIKNMEFLLYINQIWGWIPDSKLEEEALKYLIYSNISDELKDQLINIVEKLAKLNN